MDNNFNSNLETLFSKMDNFITTKTVVGEPVNIGEVIMLPLVDVMFGVGAGSSTKPADKTAKDTAGDLGGVGAKITPSAVIVIKGDTVQLVNVKNQDAISKLIDMAPGILSKFNLGSIFGNDDDKKDINKETVKSQTVTETIVTEFADENKEKDINE